MTVLFGADDFVRAPGLWRTLPAHCVIQGTRGGHCGKKSFSCHENVAWNTWNKFEKVHSLISQDTRRHAGQFMKKRTRKCNSFSPKSSRLHSNATFPRVRVGWGVWPLCEEWQRDRKSLLVLLHRGRHAWIYVHGSLCVWKSQVSERHCWPCKTPQKKRKKSFWVIFFNAMAHKCVY